MNLPFTLPRFLRPGGKEVLAERFLTFMLPIAMELQSGVVYIVETINKLSPVGNKGRLVQKSNKLNEK